MLDDAVRPIDLDVADPTSRLTMRNTSSTCLRMLDADRERADWREAPRIVLHVAPDQDAERAHRVFDAIWRAPSE